LGYPKKNRGIALAETLLVHNAAHRNHQIQAELQMRRLHVACACNI
jgi:hypothetical protein